MGSGGICSIIHVKQSGHFGERSDSAGVRAVSGKRLDHPSRPYRHRRAESVANLSK
jgi:hypothetical protein